MLSTWTWKTRSNTEVLVQFANVGTHVASPFASNLMATNSFIWGFIHRNGKEENELRFEVNGQMFFVNFVPEEGRWFCYAPTDTGLQKIPVSIDASPFEAFT